MKLTLCIVGVLAASTICSCASQRTVATTEPAVVEDTVTEVVPLQHWSAETAMQFVKGQDSTTPRVTVDPQTNSLILHGTAEDVEQMRLALQAIDKPC